MALIFLDPRSDEVTAAFNKAGNGDPVMHNATFGEVLQYMGTVVEAADERVYHEFRHRAVPGTDQRRYWRIPATPECMVALVENTKN